MILKDHPVLLIDCQTTGMRPTTGQLLEIAWTIARASDENPNIQAHLLALPPGEKIPYRVSELTGITDQDLERGKSFAEVLQALTEAAASLPDPPLSVIHYAQFEKAFLNDLFARGGTPQLPFGVVCSHALTKKLFPNLPSQNIRGTAGFFGNPVGQLKRATEHVRATVDIWRGLTAELEKKGITDFESLKTYLSAKEKIAKGRYEYRLPSEKRLALPDAPGIYRMVAKSGEVLYVGKATSLKSRVNSYFRGKAGRDKRKLEMMAQVWDLNVTECRSALEAALMEADEIKKFNPPYNVVMKKGRRHLVFYSRDFSSLSRVQDEPHPVGPFRNVNWIEHLRGLARSLKSGHFEQIFYEPIDEEQLARAFRLFCQNQKVDPDQSFSVRKLLALGLNLYRAYKDTEEVADEEASEAENDEADYTDEDIAGKYERLLRRAGHEHWRARRMTKMLNTRVTYVDKGEPRTLDFRDGANVPDRVATGGKKPWHHLGIETFDRMSVLLSELEKYEHHIEWTP